MDRLSQRYQIIIDIINGDKDLILSKKKIEFFLRNITNLIGMQIIAGPYIAEGNFSNGGLSAFVIIDFSHISVHTFLNKNSVLIDIFSCKKFDRKKAIRFSQKFFGVKKEYLHTKNVSWDK
ncbi:S-adenosylmethionine decarboxylase [Candidatus Berkelbacteria bacterium]|nr:S-adenosylmethionine decarboxylase [Candidatus Berkelbacteria bacterium]